MVRASAAGSWSINAAASTLCSRRAAPTAVRIRCSRSRERVISAVASCSRRKRSSLAISAASRGTSRAISPPLGRALTRQNDLHHVAAYLTRDGIRELARRPRAERSLHPAHPAAITGKLEQDLRRAGMLGEHELDALKQRDRPAVVEHFPEADDERRRFLLGRRRIERDENLAPG